MNSVDVTGPFFEASTYVPAMKQMQEGITRTLTNLAYQRVQTILRQNIRKPTPYYQTKIVRNTATGLVHDSDVVYGPWLEGVSSRNQETRFKGYHAFRRAFSSVNNQRERLSRPHIERMLKTLGG
jgi:hypothetical protein